MIPRSALDSRLVEWNEKWVIVRNSSLYHSLFIALFSLIVGFSSAWAQISAGSELFSEVIELTENQSATSIEMDPEDWGAYRSLILAMRETFHAIDAVIKNTPEALTAEKILALPLFNDERFEYAHTTFQHSDMTINQKLVRRLEGGEKKLIRTIEAYDQANILDNILLVLARILTTSAAPIAMSNSARKELLQARRIEVGRLFLLSIVTPPKDEAIFSAATHTDIAAVGRLEELRSDYREAVKYATWLEWSPSLLMFYAGLNNSDGPTAAKILASGLVLAFATYKFTYRPLSKGAIEAVKRGQERLRPGRSRHMDDKHVQFIHHLSYWTSKSLFLGTALVSGIVSKEHPIVATSLMGLSYLIANLTGGINSANDNKAAMDRSLLRNIETRQSHAFRQMKAFLDSYADFFEDSNTLRRFMNRLGLREGDMAGRIFLRFSWSYFTSIGNKKLANVIYSTVEPWEFNWQLNEGTTWNEELPKRFATFSRTARSSKWMKTQQMPFSNGQPNGKIFDESDTMALASPFVSRLPSRQSKSPCIEPMAYGVKEALLKACRPVIK